MSNLRIGWHMPSFPVDGSSGPAFVEQIHANMRVIEPHIDSVWVDDHLMPWATWQSNDTPYMECLTTIGYFAAAYPSLTFGASVLCQSYRNPGMMGKMMANLQLLTGGRMVFGIGAGWMEEEYRAYNYDFPSPGVRLDQLEETILLVQKLWAESPATYVGKHYRVENAFCSPRPDPIPPLLIGGGGEKRTLRLVAQYADWWNLSGGNVETYAHKIDVLRGHCADLGRDYDSILKTWSPDGIAVAATTAEAQEIAAASPYAKVPIAGTPAEVAEQLRPYLDLGIEYMFVRLLDFPRTDGIEMFLRDVVPLLRDEQA